MLPCDQECSPSDAWLPHLCAGRISSCPGPVGAESDPAGSALPIQVGEGIRAKPQPHSCFLHQASPDTSREEDKVSRCCFNSNIFIKCQRYKVGNIPIGPSLAELTPQEQQLPRFSLKTKRLGNLLRKSLTPKGD